MRTPIQILVVGVAAFVPPVIITYFFVRSGQDPQSIWCSAWLNIPAYAIAPIGIYLLTLKHLRQKQTPWRYIYPAMAAGALSVFWFFLAITIVVYFHFAFGGRP
jgi:hypothetical protein